jgi:predicted DsbA family dithiol-disulfide isomerase
VLTVADCPNGQLIEDRLAQALAGRDDVSVLRRMIADETEAQQFGMRGSPTLLINGTDPFATDSAPFSVSCRIYRTEAGAVDGAPSVAALRRAFQDAEDHTLPRNPPNDNQRLSKPNRQSTVVAWTQ